METHTLTKKVTQPHAPEGALAGGGLGLACGRVLVSARGGGGRVAGIPLRILQRGRQLNHALVRTPQHCLLHLPFDILSCSQLKLHHFIF